MAYSSTLTDVEWEIFEPLLQEILPTKKQTRPTNWTKREIFNGILYQLKNGCNWQDLPKDLPPYSTVYWHLHSVPNRWGIQGTDECLTWTSALYRLKKNRTLTTLIIIDSQAVKNNTLASVVSCMFLFLISHQWH